MAFASNIVIETFKEENNGFSVRLSFNDKYYDVCEGNFVNNTDFRCNVDSFLKILSRSNADLGKYCPLPFSKKNPNSENKNSPTKTKIEWILAIANVILVCVIIDLVCKLKSEK